MQHTLALIHTSPVLVPLFDRLCASLLPDVRRFHMVDESLIRNTIAAGFLEKTTVRRLAAQIGSTFDAGATEVLVTCSSIGPGVPVARALYDQPIFRIDEAMAASAVAAGPRIGVLATLRTTLEPTIQLIHDTANAAGKTCKVVDGLCEGAFDAVIAGDTATHDRLVSAGLREIAAQVDVVVLAQASMARILEAMGPDAPPIPILTSPELAIASIRDTLGLCPELHPAGLTA